MYRLRKLSDLELDAIDIYTHCKSKSVEHIAQDLKCPIFYIQNIIFKYLNGCVKNGYLYHKKIDAKTAIKPRRFVTLTPQAASASYQELVDCGIQLRTMLNKEM